MTVLHISGARSWGGNEQQLVDVIPELENIGVKNIVLGIEKTPLHKYVSNQNIPFIVSKEPKIHKRKNFRYLNEILKKYKPDLIHLHTSDAATLFVISDLLFRLKVPAILSKKGIGSSMSYLSLIKYNYNGIKKIICVSEAVKNDLGENVIKEKNHHKLCVVYDGVNLSRTKIVRTESMKELFNIPEDKFVIGNIANHVKAKDLGVLIEMMNFLINELSYKNVHLVQLGEFSGLTENLKLKIQDLSLENYISLGGFQDHAVDFIPQFDVYVMSSQREGLPLTIFESFYKKTPVVSTKAGGIPEAVNDGDNGFLAEVGDHKTLAKKVKNILENKDLADKFVLRSEKIFHERFVSSVTANNTLAVYKNVLES
jgi:L-malate glycosyltransferase